MLFNLVVQSEFFSEVLHRVLTAHTPMKKNKRMQQQKQQNKQQKKQLQQQLQQKRSGRKRKQSLKGKEHLEYLEYELDNSDSTTHFL